MFTKIGEAVSEGAICEAGGILTTDGNQNGIFL